MKDDVSPHSEGRRKGDKDSSHILVESLNETIGCKVEVSMQMVTGGVDLTMPSKDLLEAT